MRCARRGLALFGSLLLWASAKVQVPFYPVPMTLQTAVVFLLGIAYGWRLAVATVVLYLAEGAVGLPVFAGTPAKASASLHAGADGRLSRGLRGCGRDHRLGGRALAHWLATVGGLLAGTAAIYLLGAGWLATFVGAEKAVTLGVVPFLLGDAVKLALVDGAGRGRTQPPAAPTA